MTLTTAPEVMEAVRNTLFFTGRTTNGKEGTINCLTTNDLFLANGYINKTMHRKIEKIYAQYLKDINTLKHI